MENNNEDSRFFLLLAIIGATIATCIAIAGFYFN